LSPYDLLSSFFKVIEELVRCIREAIRVLLPVAITIPFPLPLLTMVEQNAMFLL